MTTTTDPDVGVPKPSTDSEVIGQALTVLDSAESALRGLIGRRAFPEDSRHRANVSVPWRDADDVAKAIGEATANVALVMDLVRCAKCRRWMDRCDADEQAVLVQHERCPGVGHEVVVTGAFNWSDPERDSEGDYRVHAVWPVELTCFTNDPEGRTVGLSVDGSPRGFDVTCPRCDELVRHEC